MGSTPTSAGDAGLEATTTPQGLSSPSIAVEMHEGDRIVEHLATPLYVTARRTPGRSLSTADKSLSIDQSGTLDTRAPYVNITVLRRRPARSR